MNRFQKVIVYGAAVTIGLLFLFPPYNLVMVGRGSPTFDAFYPMFSVPANRVINGDVLYLFTFGVLINAALAWLLLAGPRLAPDAPRVAEQTVVIVFGMVNLAVVLLFPPMEAFPFAQRITVGTFDGFYFAFGDKSRRSLFIPLLYMEVLFVLASACAFWLAMSIARRTPSADPGAMTMFAEAEVLRGRAEAKLGKQSGRLGALSERGPERRSKPRVGFDGPEQRQLGDRRRIGKI
jgi:hypothetical protein